MNKAKLLFIATLMCVGYNGMAQSVVSPCPQVLIDQKYDHIVSPEHQQMGWDTVVTCQNREITLTSEPYIPVQFFNGTYTVEEIPYNPPDTTFYLNGQGQQMQITSDDDFIQTPVQIPYPFYFFGIRKTQFRVGDNGIMTFTNTPMTDMHFSGPFCPYGINNPIPWTPSAGNNPGGSTYFDRTHDAIYGVYEDLYTGLNGAHLSGNQGIYYSIIDSFPCRKIICSWNQIPIYNDASKRQSYQIVCYEGSNIIEVHVKQRCAKPATSQGLLGIQNATGLPQVHGTPGESNMYVIDGSPASFAAPEWNLQTATSGTINNVAYRFTPQGTTPKTYHWYRIFDDGRDSILLTTNQNDTNGYYIPMSDNGDHPTLTQAVVRPSTPSRYVLQLSFMNADNDYYHLYDTITVGVETSYITIHDTSSATEVHDTTYFEMPYPGHDIEDYVLHDTTYVTVYDTLAAADSLSLAGCDTIVSHDIILIHDNFYTFLASIDDIDGRNVRIIQRIGQVVVEGAEGITVTLYDAAGRVLATKQSGNQVTTFDIPASGIYLIKVGSAPARRIAVVR